MLFSRNDEQLKASELVSEMLKLKAGGTEMRVPSVAVFNLRIAVVRFGLRFASQCHPTEKFLSVNSIQLTKCKSLYLTNCKKYRKTNNEFVISDSTPLD